MKDYTKPECKKLEALTTAECQLIYLIRNRQKRTVFPLLLEIVLTRETIKFQERRDS